MHDGMPYDTIQGQGHGASDVPKIALFKVYLHHYLHHLCAIITHLHGSVTVL